MLEWINLYESLFNWFSHQWSIVSHTVTRFLTLQMRKIRFINALFLVNSPCFLMIFIEHSFYLSELLILDNTKHSRKKTPCNSFFQMPLLVSQIFSKGPQKKQNKAKSTKTFFRNNRLILVSQQMNFPHFFLIVMLSSLYYTYSKGESQRA